MLPAETYQMLVNEAQSVGWPRAFRDDLFVHDRDAIFQRHAQVFVWVLRESGTHLFDATWLPEAHQPSCTTVGCFGLHEGAIGWLRAVGKTEPDARYYTYRDGKLTLVSFAAAEAFLLAAQREILTGYYEQSLGRTL